MKSLNVLIVSLLCLFLTTEIFASDYRVIINRSKNLRAINQENGKLDCTEFKKGWWSAQWKLVPVEGSSKYFRIESRQKSGHFIHVENGKPTCSKLGKPGWWSAQWKIVPIGGNKYCKIENRARGGKNFLHIEDGSLSCGPLGKPGWYSAQWQILSPSKINQEADSGPREIQEVVDENGAVIMKYQFNEAGFKHTTECSNPLTDPATLMYNKVFAPACHVHDYNYRAPWRMAGFPNYVGKKISDDKFYKDMLAVCDDVTNNIIAEAECKAAALTWSAFVRNHPEGKEAFDNGQKAAEDHCDKSSISAGGLITVYSDAGYVTEVTVSYKKNEGGNSIKVAGIDLGDVGTQSEKITYDTSCEIPIPAGATNIVLTVNGIWCGLNFTKEFKNPVKKCYKVWGTIADTEWKEIRCR